MLASMSCKGNCYDNASLESFWESLKNELIHHQRSATKTNAEAAIKEYLEIFYNCQRRHSRLGYVSPAQFAESISKTCWPLETAVSIIDSTPQRRQRA